jgi:hypothetical protein
VQPGERRGVLRVQDVREPAAPRLARRAWTERRNGVVDSHTSNSIRHDIVIKAERVTLSGLVLCSLFLNVGLRGGMQPGALHRRQLEILYILYGLFLLRALNRAQRGSRIGPTWQRLVKELQSLSRLVFLVESGGCGVENAYQDPCAVELSSPSKMPIAERQRAPRTRPQGQMCISRHNQQISPAQGRILLIRICRRQGREK